MPRLGGNTSAGALDGTEQVPFLDDTYATVDEILERTPITQPVASLTNSAGTVAVNCALGPYFTLALGANVTSITFSNLPASAKGVTLMVTLTQDATGSRTVAWPASFRWAGGVAGVVSTAANAKDLLAITTFDQGTTWYATLAKAYA